MFLGAFILSLKIWNKNIFNNISITNTKYFSVSYLKGKQRQREIKINLFLHSFDFFPLESARFRNMMYFSMDLLSLDRDNTKIVSGWNYKRG